MRKSYYIKNKENCSNKPSLNQYKPAGWRAAGAACDGAVVVVGRASVAGAAGAATVGAGVGSGAGFAAAAGAAVGAASVALR